MKTYFIVVVVLVAITMSGCATSRRRPYELPPQRQSIYFDNDYAGGIYPVENKNDFKTLYDNACYLFLQGKYRHAAKIFLQAAEASPSENGAIVSLVSAAECSLAASDNRAFIEIREW